MKKVAILLGVLVVFASCRRSVEGNGIKGYEPKMLKDWAEKMILPAYQDYRSKASQLEQTAKLFKETPDENYFSQLKEQWKLAYKAFEKTMIFDMELSDNQESVYLELSNTFPSRTTSEQGISIEGNISLIEQGKADEVLLGGEYKSTYDTQGLPALDYLLFAPGKDLDYYQSNAAARQYLYMLTQTLLDTVSKITQYWEDSSFVNRYANTTNLSRGGWYNRTVSTFIRVYERQIRAQKVGYAAGAIRGQAGQTAPFFIEAYYQQEISKELLVSALKSSQDFFNGIAFNGEEIKGLKHILIQEGHQDLVQNINHQYELAYQAIAEKNQTLRELAVQDTPQMKKIYDALQTNVLHYKSQMIRVLNAQIEYRDTDGD